MLVKLYTSQLGVVSHVTVRTLVWGAPVVSLADPGAEAAIKVGFLVVREDQIVLLVQERADCLVLNILKVKEWKMFSK